MMNSRTGIRCSCKLCNRNNYIKPGVGRIYVDPVTPLTLVIRYQELHREHIGEITITSEQAKVIARVLVMIYRNLGLTKKSDEITTCTPIRMLINWQIIKNKTFIDVMEADVYQWSPTFDWHQGYGEVLGYKALTILDEMCQSIKLYKNQQEQEDDRQFLDNLGLDGIKTHKEKIDWRWQK